MSTIRVAKRLRFTTVDRDTINDQSLSYRARGVLFWLLDKPDEWQTSAERIAAVAPEGRDAVRTALRELEQRGYLVRTKYRDNDGAFHTEWTIHERPNGTSPGRISRPSESVAGEPMRDSRPQLETTEIESLTTDFQLPSREDCAPPPWVAAGLTYPEWREREHAR